MQTIRITNVPVLFKCSTELRQALILAILLLGAVFKIMSYKKINLFGHQSRGTFDDFYSKNYSSLQDAYDANDYVQADFVQDENGTLFIEAHNVKNPEVKKYHRLNFQRPVAGLDIMDDSMGAEMAASLL